MEKGEKNNTNPRQGVILRDASWKGWLSRPEWDFDLFDSMVEWEHRLAGISGPVRAADYIGKAMWICFVLVVISGIGLLSGYKPTIDGSFISVTFIQESMFGGWWLRGIHRYASDLLLILAIARLARICYRRAYKNKGRHTWLFGLVFLLLFMCGMITGHLLVWNDPENFRHTMTQDFISGVFALHLGITILVAVITIFWRFTARRLSPGHLNFNMHMPPGMILGIIGLLSILALIAPPEIGGVIERYFNNAPVFSDIIFLSIFGLIFLSATTSGHLVMTIGLVVAYFLPWIDRYSFKGPRPAVTALTSASLLTPVCIGIYAYLPDSPPMNLYLAISGIWLFSFLLALGAEHIKHKTSGRKNEKAGDA